MAEPSLRMSFDKIVPSVSFFGLRWNGAQVQLLQSSLLFQVPPQLAWGVMRETILALWK